MHDRHPAALQCFPECLQPINGFFLFVTVIFDFVLLIWLEALGQTLDKTYSICD